MALAHEYDGKSHTKEEGFGSRYRKHSVKHVIKNVAWSLICVASIIQQLDNQQQQQIHNVDYIPNVITKMRMTDKDKIFLRKFSAMAIGNTMEW